jgi:hypothetical protein
VAVEERENPETGEMTLKKVPIALTRDWGGTDTRTFAKLVAPSRVMASIAPVSFPKRQMPDEDEGICFDLCESDAGSRYSLPRGAGASVSRPAPPALSSGDRERSLFSRLVEPARKLRKKFDAAAPTASPSPRPLDRLVGLQKADGSWDLDEELAMVLGVPLATIEKALAGVSGDPALVRRTGATALALFWLERSAAGEEDEWSLLARKARVWLGATRVLPPGGSRWNSFAAAILASRPAD